MTFRIDCFTRRATVVAASLGMLAGRAIAQNPNTNDPRVGLKGGWMDAAEAISNLTLVSHTNRPEGFVNPQNPGDFSFVNADLAFDKNLVIQGGFNGVQFWDVSNPASPKLRSSIKCAGGQGDVSVYRNLLFMSVEETRGRLDCSMEGVKDTVSKERFRGVRIFDISNLDAPKQVADVQTCRGSHTHTLVTDPNDKANVYIYVSGTSVVRSPNELAGCSAKPPEQDPNTSLFRIDIIKVPLAAPQNAKVVSSPRVFAANGKINGLWAGGTHGEGTQTSNETNQCHDITVYTSIGLAAGACSGNGILLDIKNPAAPKRVAEVADPNFAYWHSATFNNDGTKLLFTDEWGGGVAPRCRASDKLTWGADAIFKLSNNKLTQEGYFKMPAPQTDQENCVAHNGSLIPVPGRDIMVQAWYQGGMSIFDFTDAAHPKEIAYFDRGPLDSAKLVLSGYWSAYWYNGHIYGSEIARGLDILDLKPSDMLSQNEIDAAKLVTFEMDNPQNQQKFVWPANIVVPRAYVDQLTRDNGLSSERLAAITKELDRADGLKGGARSAAFSALAAKIDGDAKGASDSAKVKALAASVRKLAAAK